jgi:hypothetical protein
MRDIRRSRVGGPIDGRRVVFVGREVGPGGESSLSMARRATASTLDRPACNSDVFVEENDKVGLAPAAMAKALRSIRGHRGPGTNARPAIFAERPHQRGKP